MFSFITNFFKKPSAPANDVSVQKSDFCYTELLNVYNNHSLPLEKVRLELWKLIRSTNDLKLMHDCNALASTIEDLMVNRNINGKEFEKSGEINKAIDLYEKNVADEFDGSHPYERLRIIYKGQGDIKKMVDVCKSYLLVGSDENLRAKYEKIIQKFDGV